jgi:hypothetical protein
MGFFKIRSLAAPEKLGDKSYGVLCMITGPFGMYRSMMKFRRMADATRFYSRIEGFE